MIVSNTADVNFESPFTLVFANPSLTGVNAVCPPTMSRAYCLKAVSFCQYAARALKEVSTATMTLFTFHSGSRLSALPKG